MADLTAKRTLVKSPPELWSELSELERLARHLGAFGEIRITKLEPEHTVAWEGESASGTVSIEPSGWGTKVTLTAQLEDGAGAAASDVGADEPPAAEAAAEEGERDVPDVPEAGVVEGVVEERSVAEPFLERAETIEERAGETVEQRTGAEGGAEGDVEARDIEAGRAAEEPAIEHVFGRQLGLGQPVAPEPEPERPVVREPEVAQLIADEAEETHPVVDEPESEEPAVEEERATPKPPEPIQAEPRRKRGFLAWLFRPRTSTQVPPSRVATRPAPTPSEAVDEATAVAGDPVAADEPVVARAPVMPEAPPAASWVAEATPVAEASSVAGGRPVADAAPVAEDPPGAAEFAAEHAHTPPGLDPERAQAILDEALEALGSAHHRPFSRG